MIQGKAEDIDKIKDLKSLADVIEEHKEDYSSEVRPMNAAITPDMLLHSLSDVSSLSWLKEDGTLDEKVVREFYTQCQRIWKVSEESAKKFLEEMGQSDENITYSREYNMIAGDTMSVLGGSILLGEGGMYSSNDLAYLYSAEQQDTDLKSVLFNGQSENNFIPEQTIGISSKSKYKKEAEKFIQYLFGEEGQKIGADQGFPVNKKAYEDERAGYFLILPSFTGVAVFWVIPYLDVIRRLFTSAISGKFTGFDNYRTVLGNTAFRLAAGNTARFFGICIPLLVVLSVLNGFKVFREAYQQRNFLRPQMLQEMF